MNIVFMGTPDFAVPGLQALLRSAHPVVAVVTQPDRPQGRGLALTPSPVKRAALAQGVEVLQPASVNDPAFLERLRALAPDLMITAAFGQILKREILGLPPRGCLNVHASLLPKYRGAAPIAWAIARGEAESGITIMQMDEGLDTGPILVQRRLALAADETGGSLHDKLAALSAGALGEALAALEAGTLQPVRQDSAHATLAPMLQKSDGRLDWTRPAMELERRVRAFDPWPGAYFEREGRAIKVWKAAVTDRAGRPGEVLGGGREGLLVACGAGSLSILELQPPGKRRMAAAEFLRGHEHPADLIH